jgi:hypothetical protein
MGAAVHPFIFEAGQFPLGSGWEDAARESRANSRKRLLVTIDVAFYNPRITALDIVGMSIRHPSAGLTDKQNGCRFRERVLSIDFHFRNSQEH